MLRFLKRNQRKLINVQKSQPKIFLNVHADWKFSKDYKSDSCISFLEIL